MTRCACCDHFETFGKDGLCVRCREAGGLTNKLHEHPWIPKPERRVEDVLQEGWRGL